MDEGDLWQGTTADTITPSTSSSGSQSDADSRPSSGERFDVGKSRRPWSPNKFAQRIAQAATTGGDDKALADILNAFPEMGTDAATLWLQYIKGAVAAGGSVDSSIMRLFPVVNWQDVLVDEESRRLFPEIDRLLKSSKDGDQAQERALNAMEMNLALCPERT
ncbi:hypothetical protein AURDEDRAFT_167790 [Auricularia subglabra TFB-10046 SS5]|nr:hypothetical protein AURDEDRAFT_167790 [Auricularia subglabra TFB-10046 SS5]